MNQDKTNIPEFIDNVNKYKFHKLHTHELLWVLNQYVKYNSINSLKPEYKTFLYLLKSRTIRKARDEGKIKILGYDRFTYETGSINLAVYDYSGFIFHCGHKHIFKDEKLRKRGEYNMLNEFKNQVMPIDDIFYKLNDIVYLSELCIKELFIRLNPQLKNKKRNHIDLDNLAETHKYKTKMKIQKYKDKKLQKNQIALTKEQL